MDTINIITTYGVAAVAVLAFIVSMITEVIKELKPLDTIPTNLVVIVLSMVITTVFYFSLNEYYGRPYMWYELCTTIIAAFIVAFVAMYGWTKFTELWDRFKK